MPALATKTRVRDTYVRADDASSINPATSGQLYSVGQGTAGISSNQGYFPSDTDKDHIDLSGIGNGTVSLEVKGQGGVNNRIPYLTVRGSAADVHLLITLSTGNTVRLMKRNVGSFTVLASASFTTNDNTYYTTKVVMAGAVIKIYMDGSLLITHTLVSGDEVTYAPTAILVGVSLAKTAAPSVDAFFRNLLVHRNEL